MQNKLLSLRATVKWLLFILMWTLPFTNYLNIKTITNDYMLYTVSFFLQLVFGYILVGAIWFFLLASSILREWFNKRTYYDVSELDPMSSRPVYFFPKLGKLILHDTGNYYAYYDYETESLVVCKDYFLFSIPIGQKTCSSSEKYVEASIRQILESYQSFLVDKKKMKEEKKATVLDRVENDFRSKESKRDKTISQII